ncbi:MAG: cell division protein ZapE [Geminicoccaceae bacterium]|nr:cell division protein ZapE [Geminicoccaceae bacterium]
MLRTLLDARIARGELELDPLQRAAAERLETLAHALAASPPPAPAKGLLARFLGPRSRPAAAAAGGIYLHGRPGRGKSMLLDLFVEAVPIAAKRRVHFQPFMLEVHARLNALRKDAAKEEPIAAFVRELAAYHRLLCLDELEVRDIADAMILGRLVEGLLDAGVAIVATSNLAPERLYEGGLNRELFLPTIALLRRRLEVVALDGPVDYRLRRLEGLPLYLCPLGPETERKLERIVAVLADGRPLARETLDAGGRPLLVPKAAGAVALFDFLELCERPLGPADYLALTDRYRAIVLAGVPLLTPDRRNEARRFVTLVDALYERKVILVMSAAAEPDALYPEGEGAFEFRRTVSRLVEMRSREWLERCRARRPEELPASFTPFALTSDLL